MDSGFGGGGGGLERTYNRMYLHAFCMKVDISDLDLELTLILSLHWSRTCFCPFCDFWLEILLQRSINIRSMIQMIQSPSETCESYYSETDFVFF